MPRPALRFPSATARPLALAALLLAAWQPSAAAAQTPLAAGVQYAFNYQTPAPPGFASGFGFGFDDPDGRWLDAGDAPWTFTASRAFFVTLLDADLVGDRFELLEVSGGAPVVLGTTSAADLSDPTRDCGLDPVACAADAAFSRGRFRLAAGSYAFDVRGTTEGIGSGFLRLDVDTAVVPEPGTWVLLGTGLAGVGLVARRRRGRG